MACSAAVKYSPYARCPLQWRAKPRPTDVGHKDENADEDAGGATVRTEKRLAVMLMRQQWWVVSNLRPWFRVPLGGGWGGAKAISSAPFVCAGLVEDFLDGANGRGWADDTPARHSDWTCVCKRSASCHFQEVEQGV